MNQTLQTAKTAEDWAKLASVHSQNGNIKDAIELFEKTIELDPQNHDYRCSYAILVGREGDFDKAIDICNEILNEDPNHNRAFQNLGVALLLWGNSHGSAGWFTQAEAAHLYRVIQAIESSEPVIVELGSCFGLSSMIIARALRNKPNAKIYCVDAWEGDGTSVFAKTRAYVQEQAEKGISFFDMFKNNMTRSGYWESVTPVQGYTTEVVKTWTEAADLVFVDADHSYEGVRKDVRDWRQHIKVGGQILMHDVELKMAGSNEDSGPGKVVQEFFPRESNFGDATLMDTLYLARKKF